MRKSSLSLTADMVQAQRFIRRFPQLQSRGRSAAIFLLSLSVDLVFRTVCDALHDVRFPAGVLSAPALPTGRCDKYSLLSQR